MDISESDWLAHVGTPQEKDFDPHGSGRYRQGSGDNPYQRAKDFKARVAKIRRDYKKANGVYIKDKELVAYLFGDDSEASIRKFRAEVTKTKAEIDAKDYQDVHRLSVKGNSVKAIAAQLDMPASRVRRLLSRDQTPRVSQVTSTADILRETLESKKGYIDVGFGSELTLNVGRSNFDAAVRQLESEGYVIRKLPVRQMFGKGNTTIKALCPPGTTRADLYRGLDKLEPPADVRVNKEGEIWKLRPIENVSSSRIAINYAEDGGTDKDGVIELRRGVKDLDLGNSHYAQVRIGVDGTHYLKGMAIYADDLPDGIDIRFNTNKHRGTPMIATEPGGKEVLKPMKDPSNLLNPFGASVKQFGQRGALNIVNEEGDWSKWSKTLASQFLSKQYDATAKRQLKATADVAFAEFEEIKSLTNPTIKRYLLQEFADSCDADAVHLKAVRLPGQSQKVLLPTPEIRADQCYCPSLKDGTQVALVRYPHGGIFEIPILTVNSRGQKARRLFGDAQDAIGIHPSKAETLSGADFDGDTVMVLPLTGSFKIRANQRGLPELKGFDPKTQFNGDHLSSKDLMKKGNVQNQMGSISNLITDMTLQGADNHELARAVAHSMVVIDAYKHKLDYKASEKYFRIDELRQKYQNGGGASTLISSAKSQYRFPEVREKAVSRLTPEERERWERGEKIYEPTNGTHYDFKKSKKEGHPVYSPNITVGTKMGDMVKDAYELSSGTRMESYYADYANTMKSLANQARAEMRATGKLEYSSTAYQTYKSEVSDLKKKLNEAFLNKPLERKAQALANSTWQVERSNHPEYTKEEEKKAKSRHLEAARAATGAGKRKSK